LAKFRIATPRGASFTTAGDYGYELEALTPIDAEIFEVPAGSEDEFVSAARDADALYAKGRPITKRMIDPGSRSAPALLPRGCAHPGVVGPRVDFERALERLSRFFQGCWRSGSVPPVPSAHDEVARIGIDSFALLASCGFSGDQFEDARGLGAAKRDKRDPERDLALADRCPAGVRGDHRKRG
jgi:hypothetical protein